MRIGRDFGNVYCTRGSLALVDIVGRDGCRRHGRQRGQRSLVAHAAFVRRHAILRRCAFARFAAAPATAPAAPAFTFATFTNATFGCAALGRLAVAGFGARHRGSAFFDCCAFGGCGCQPLDIAGIFSPAFSPVATATAAATAAVPLALSAGFAQGNGVDEGRRRYAALFTQGHWGAFRPWAATRFLAFRRQVVG